MAIKILVAAAGIVVIVLINWYFLFSRRKS
jgi:plastocyanin domain-containing protein